MRSLAAVALLCVVAAAFCFAIPAVADDFHVTSGADSGAGSLRWAIESANATPGGDLLTVDNTLTIHLTSPLPAVSGFVAFVPAFGAAGAILDGTDAGDTDGLVLLGDRSSVEALTITNFRGDGLVMAGNHGWFRHLVLSNNRNGMQIRGSESAIYGSWIANNRAAGVWVTASGSGNVIGAVEPVPGVFFPEPIPITFPTDYEDVIGGNGTGIILDGNANVVDGAGIGAAFSIDRYVSAANAGDGIVANGTGNRVQNTRIVANGGAGITLNAPAEISATLGCNSGPLIVGSEERAPVLLSAVRNSTSMTIDGRLDALPGAPYRIEFYSLDHECSGALSTTSLDVITNSNGTAMFHVSNTLAANRIAATATRIAKNGNATSPFSLPIDSVKNGAIGADLEATMTAPPVAAPGSTITVEIRVTNHGPAPASGAYLYFAYPSSLALIDSTTTSGSCSLEGSKWCLFDLLQPGQTATVHQQLRVDNGEMRRTYAATVTWAGAPGQIDPDPSNNRAAVTIGIAGRLRAARH